MTVTALDPKTALIVIDLQKAMLAYAGVHPVSEVISRASLLANAFRRRNLPVVLVNVAGGAPGRTEQTRARSELPAEYVEFVPELNQQPEDHTITKRAWGAFGNTDLEEFLKKDGVTQVVIAGISTSIGVESTARHAYELGFNVTLAVDAMTDSNQESHDHSLKLFTRLGQTGTTEEIITLLETGNV